jgi:hypothetical protein
MMRSSSSRHQDLITGWLTSATSYSFWGRPVGVLVAADGSLLISDDDASARTPCCLARSWRAMQPHVQPAVPDAARDEQRHTSACHRFVIACSCHRHDPITPPSCVRPTLTTVRRGQRSGPPHAWTDRHERTRKDDSTMITTTHDAHVSAPAAPMPRPRLASLTRPAALHWPRFALGAVLALAALLNV